MIIKTKNNTYKWRPEILIRNIIILICLAFLLWVGISYGEILMKNLNVDPMYSDWNIFIILSNMVEGGVA